MAPVRADQSASEVNQEQGLGSAKELSPAEDWRIDFDDLTQDQKIERLRNTIKDQRDAISYLRRKLDRYEDHVHGPDGKVMVPLKDHRIFGDSGGRDRWL